MALASIPVVGDVYEKFMRRFEEGKAKQGIAGKVVMEAVKGLPQGCLLGACSISLSNMMTSAQSTKAMTPDQRKSLEMTLKSQPKSIPEAMIAFSALFCVQYGMLEAIKHYRKEKDVWNVYASAHAVVLSRRSVNRSGQLFSERSAASCLAAWAQAMHWHGCRA
jgi:hypothetical protein